MTWLLALAAIKAAKSPSVDTEIESYDRIPTEAR
jgi:hypothetical protein